MKKYIIIGLSAVLSLVACNRDFEEPNPNAVTLKLFWKNSSDAVKGVNAVYSTFKLTPFTYSRFMFYHGILKSDEGYGSGGDINLNNSMRFNEPNTNADTRSGTWKILFVGVFRANQVIANVPNIEMDAVLKARLIGEAKFLRALFYYNLTLYYGRPPLLLNPSQPDDKPVNATTEEAYAQVAKDLIEAAEVLPATYTNSADLGRATKGAAFALLGKTYLQQKKYSLALDAFDWLVTGAGKNVYDLMPNYRDNFLISTENNKESVFEVQFNENLAESTDNDTDEGRQSNTGTSISQFFAPSRGMGNTVELGYADGGARRWLVDEFLKEKTALNQQDPRLAVSLLFDNSNPAGPNSTQVYGRSWSSRYGNGDKKVWFRKLLNDHWKNQEGFRSPNNYRLIRYADVLLMYAECLNGLDRTAEAYPYVDRVRARAGMTTLTIAKPGLLKAPFLEQLKHERITELTGEAWRWADLLRWGDLSPALSTRDEDFLGFVVGKDEYYPIPQADIDLNPNLTQNY